MKKNYNYCLDLIKGIACFCVVCMHCEFPGKLGIIVQAVSRFCVPFFFMVSGYFCFYGKGAEEKSVKQKLKPIIKLTILAVILNLCWVIAGVFRGSQNINVSIKDIVVFIFFNTPFILISSYWFLFALIYDYLLYMIVKKYNLYKLAYIMIPVLLVCYVILAQGLHIAGIRIPGYLYKNFLIEGFPFFMLGHFLHSRQDKINIKNSVLLIMIILFSALCLLERDLLGRDFGVNICSIPQVIAIFIFGMVNPLKGSGVLQRIGKSDSMYVYVFHPVVYRVLEVLYHVLGISESSIALYLMPIVTILSSLVLAEGYRKVSGWIKRESR